MLPHLITLCTESVKHFVECRPHRPTGNCPIPKAELRSKPSTSSPKAAVVHN